jgi:hypothetical protein
MQGCSIVSLAVCGLVQRKQARKNGAGQMGLVERAAYYTYRGDKLEFLKKPGNYSWLVPNIGEPKGDETKGEANGVEAAELALAELPGGLPVPKNRRSS